MSRHQFPDDFVWGAATSAQQIEGGRHEGGRGDSIWDRFADRSGKIQDGSNADVACDHYHRWREDLEFMKWLGLGGYRFSIAWPRIFPEGRGRPNEAGLDFYEALVDGLLEAGIRPFPTLYHWDLPQALQDEGGWSRRDTARVFADYSAAVARRLGDRIGHWVTHNEPWCAATLGHEEGHHAPGHEDPAEALRAAHHLLLSHGWACEALRKEVPSAELGIVNIHCPAHPKTDSEADRDAARWFDGFFNRWYMDPIFKGSYPEDAVADRVAAGHLPGPEIDFVKDGDLAAISAPLDFLGVNYYSRAVLRAGEDGRRIAENPAPIEERTDMDWEVYPSGLHESLLRIHRDFAPAKIYLMENGAAYDDPRNADGRIVDSRRIDYLREHLLFLHRAMSEGVPVKGYFTWSLMDNFEWGYGYNMRFGLYALDSETLDRIPRDSAYWYREVAGSGGLDEAVHPSIQGESRVLDD